MSKNKCQDLQPKICSNTLSVNTKCRPLKDIIFFIQSMDKHGKYPLILLIDSSEKLANRVQTQASLNRTHIDKVQADKRDRWDVGT
jgi:hypothetical protein